ncbi:hypothetical protein [Terasakiella pusilla]|uniref:hypothetical protein n=1 Tax=Terasakiella pusilla TaxID=64973 RepID=UPI003AA7B105
MDWLAGKIDDILIWMAEMLQWLFVEKLFGGIMSVLGDAIAAIPVPDFMGDIGMYASDIAGSQVGWLWNVFAFSEGIAIIAAAYGIRFAIRRLPVIG